MRFQPKLLLVGVAVVGVGTFGYAATRGAGPGQSIESLLETTICHAAGPEADGKQTGGVQQDHAGHGHEHLAHEHATQSHATVQNVLGVAEPAATSDRYTCPMHPNIVANEPGNCPICGMHLVKIAQDKSGESTEQDHAGHAHEHFAHEQVDQSRAALEHVLVAAEPAATADKSADKYTCPMHPAIVTNEPGNCPICGMHLVKIAKGESGNGNAQVHVNAQTQQRMGVQLQTAEVAGMHRAINTFATIAPDQSRSVSVNSFVEGWIKRWHVQGVGQKIRKGQVLYEIYSPDMQQRQREYINILTRRDAMQASNGGMGMSAGKGVDMSGPAFVMMRALAKDRFRARDRLLAAGLSSQVLEQLEEYRRVQDVVPIHATQDGVVTEISVREGSYINPLQPLLVYTDNSRAWAEVTLYPDQVGWLEDGNDVTLTSGLDATTRIHARVDLSTLQIDPVSRTAKLRLPISNTGNAFYPGSYAKVTIKADERHVLSVPRDAVIRTGHGQYVVVSESPDHFRSAAVETGIENAHSVEIRSGLQPGASVVVNGQFLLDAAASLQSMQNRLAAAPVHGSHDAAGAAAPIASAMPVSPHSHAHP